MLRLIFIFVVLLLLPAFYSWTSRLNQFFFFGRTVPAHFPPSDAGRAITRQYLCLIWTGFVPILAVSWIMYRHHNFSFLLLAVMVEWAVFRVAFARAHNVAGRLAPAVAPRPAVEVPLAPAANPPSIAALLAPLIASTVIVASPLIYLAHGSSSASLLEQLDALISMHGGEMLFGFGIGLGFGGPFGILLRLKARTRTPLGNHALQGVMLAAWVGALSLAITFGVAFAGGHISRTESKAVLFGSLLIAALLAFWRTYTHRRFVPPLAEMQADENWRWGFLYWNSSDPALFVQCRCGAGYTLNYGRFLAWPISVVFVGFLVTAFVLSQPH